MGNSLQACCQPTLADSRQGNGEASATWPPKEPPKTTKMGDIYLIQSYLRRLNKPDTPQANWVCRWIELEFHDPKTEPEYKSDYMLCVYKTAAKKKRLNAVIFRRISEVQMLKEEPVDGDEEANNTFAIRVGDAIYHLQAANRTDAEKWVAVLAKNIETLSSHPPSSQQ